MRSHTGTHILLAAAMNILGKHIWQAGAQKGLFRNRLDITHYQRIAPDDVRKIERLANKYVMQNIPVITRIMNRTLAEKKYGFRLYQGGIVPGKDIRIVEIKDLNVQACGGTHVQRTGEVGFIKILKTSRIQDGIVRIEFACGSAAIDYVQEQEKLLSEASNLLHTPEDRVIKSILKLKEELASIKEQNKIIWSKYSEILIKNMLHNKLNFGPLQLVTATLAKLTDDLLINLAASITKSDKNMVVILFNITENKLRFIMLAGDEAVDYGFNAGYLAKEIAKIINGKGGGQRSFAQGIGLDTKKIDDIKDLVSSYLSSLTKKKQVNL